jgi:hypothetical protein
VTSTMGGGFESIDLESMKISYTLSFFAPQHAAEGDER